MDSNLQTRKRDYIAPGIVLHVCVCKFGDLDFIRMPATPSYIMIEMAPIFFVKFQVYVYIVQLNFFEYH